MSLDRWIDKEVVAHIHNGIFSSVQFSRSVVSNSLQLHEPQHIGLPCPSASPRAYSNSCPLNQWCHLTISFSVIPFCSCLQSSLDSGELALLIMWPKCRSFNFSIIPSTEYSGLTSFRIDWFDLFAVQEALKSSSVSQFESFFYGSGLTSVHDYWKTVALTIQAFVGKVMFLLFNMLSRLVITFIPRSKRLLIS